MKAVVAGGTGLVGKKLIHCLSQENYITEIHSFARRNIWQNNSKVKFHQVDFEKLVPRGEKFDLAFCCLGTTIKKAGSKEAFLAVDLEYVMNFAEYCKEAAVKSFSLVSSYGANPKSFSFYSKTKGKVENDLSKLSFEKLWIYRPSLLIGERDENRLAEDLGKKIYQHLGRSFWKPYLGTKADDLASLMAKNALKNEGSKISIVGPTDI